MRMMKSKTIVGIVIDEAGHAVETQVQCLPCAEIGGKLSNYDFLHTILGTFESYPLIIDGEKVADLYMDGNARLTGRRKPNPTPITIETATHLNGGGMFLGPLVILGKCDRFGNSTSLKPDLIKRLKTNA